MDWIVPAITAAAGVAGGLGGAWIMGRFTLRAQELSQRAENGRHARKLAYDAAIAAWCEYRDTFKAKIDKGVSGDVEEKIQPLQDFLVAHLVFADATLREITAESSVEDIKAVLRATRDTSYFLREYRDSLIEEGTQRLRDAAQSGK